MAHLLRDWLETFFTTENAKARSFNRVMRASMSIYHEIFPIYFGPFKRSRPKGDLSVEKKNLEKKLLYLDCFFFAG